MKLLSILLFTTFTFFAFAQSDTTNQMTGYSNASYSVQYPVSWKIDTSKKLGTDFVISSSKENDNDKFVENVNLIVQNLNGQNIDLYKYARLSEEQINKLATDGKIFESKKVEGGKTVYYKIIFGMTQVFSN